jgi:hypothetical protein
MGSCLPDVLLAHAVQTLIALHSYGSARMLTQYPSSQPTWINNDSYVEKIQPAR